MESPSTRLLTCCASITTCLLLSVAFVASLYIWGTRESRDHPSVIIRRFYSVFIVMCLSPPLVYWSMDGSIMQKTTMLHLLGFKLDGLFQAVFYPLVLTTILFLGSLSMQGLTGLWQLYAEPTFWVWNLSDVTFLRNLVVAPIAEEFVFRACMMPLLLQCFNPLSAIFIAPLFFGVAHLHHMLDRLRHEKLSFQDALIVSCYQMSYSTIFGVYSAFLFVRTGHFAAPCVAHAFCNHMGCPDFSEAYKNPQRFIVLSLYVIGFLLWCLLLTPLTDPVLYNNNMFWMSML